MINLKRFSVAVFIVSIFLASNTYSWNSLGHRLVAQIAYDHLTPHAKTIYNQYNSALDRVYRRQNLINAAAWLDSLRYQNQLWLAAKHYIDIPFSWDGTELIQPDENNAVTAIAEASNILQDNLINNFDKGFTLRILLHVVGDIHQPLHAANQFTAAHPKGDQGGNLFKLGANHIATNLHSYWDKGGGYLDNISRYNASKLKLKAASIERRWPCHVQEMNLVPKVWAEESYQLATEKVYQLHPGQIPSIKYQGMTQMITEQRIALAGCRLAALLNKLA